MSALPEEIAIEKEYIEKTLDMMWEALGRSVITPVELSAQNRTVG